MSSLPPPPPPPSGFSTLPAQGYDGRGEVAGFGVRLGGYLLDSLLYGLLWSAFLIPAIIMGASSVKDCDRSTDSDGVTNITCRSGQLNGGLLAGAIVIGVIGIIVVTFLYVNQLGKTGQTWGRKIVGIKVVDMATQQPLGFGKAFGRTLFEMLISRQICALGYLWMLWDADKQTWHDKIVKSNVYRV